MFKDQLLRGYERYYDTFESYEALGLDFEFFAKYYQRNSKYMAVKKMEYYAFSNFEEVYYKHYEHFDMRALSEINAFINRYLDQFSPADEDHMETLITVIASTGVCVSDDIKKAVEKLNPSKSILWGLKGWIKVKLILIDPQSNIITNKFGQNDQIKLAKLLS
ncbi:MAG: hypothetical protein SCL54_04670 [Bacillota bacterium]|nr:hypothetical protein [Bacillota bacterium]